MFSTRYNLTEIPELNNIMYGTNVDDTNINDTNTNINDTNILKLNKVECRTSNNAKYSVIRYDKKLLTSDLISTYGLCRSIIVNSQNRVVSFAPPKSISSEQFITKYPENTHGVVAEEFLEGTMMNVFWDSSLGLNGSWEIATRNTPGATSSFFKSQKNKTFRDMFLEAMNASNLKLDMLNKEYCYSFVLQHPENRIVIPFKTPQLYLVALYYIQYIDSNIFVNVVDRDLFKYYCINSSVNINIKFPETYELNKYAELIEKYASMNTSYDIVGVVLYNTTTSERSKIRNPVYEQVRNLRGNQPKLQYQYLSLRKEGRVKDFLKFYPENKKQFSDFRDQVHLFTNTLFSNYKSCYVKKEKPLKDFSQEYRTHMFHIHQIFINELRENRGIITNTVVQKYVNEMPTTLLMYCLNFQMRKRNVETISADSNL